MLFSLAKALVIAAALVIAGTTMYATLYATLLMAEKLGLSQERGLALGCFAAIAVPAAVAFVALQLLYTSIYGG